MTNGSLDDLLAGWLPSQRWFAGSGAILRDVAIRSDVQLAPGDPELRHLLADATVGTQTVRYQVLVGLVSQLRPDLARAAIGTLDDGRTAYDGAIDPDFTALLLEGIASERSAGPIRFRAEPGAAIEVGDAGRTLAASASNTSVVYGDKAKLKLIRRPSEGQHPDLEIPAALARLGSRLVAAPLGWIEMSQAGGAAEPTILAILSEYFTPAKDGWSLAMADLQSAQSDFSEQARLLGQATARLHTELAAAFGTSSMPAAALAEMARVWSTELTWAVAVVPELATHCQAIMNCYEELADRTGEVAIQRIHGDYHLAQVLATNDGWVILDFEGEPSVSLTRRRAFAPKLRDIAGMLRSFDYVARHQVQAEPQNGKAADWVRRCQDAFCTGYGTEAGEDPRNSGELLRALLLQKAVYEAVYEARHRPGWLPIPLHAIAEAVRESDR